MKFRTRRIVAAAAAGVVASAMLATPALAVKPDPLERGDGYVFVQLWNDAHRIPIGHIRVDHNFDGTYSFYVEDTHDEGLTVTARIDNGDGVGRDLVTSRDSDPINDADTPTLRKWRLVWGTYATGWYPPPV